MWKSIVLDFSESGIQNQDERKGTDLCFNLDFNL